MDTAGKAVLFSGVTVLISLSAVMLVPSPAFRSVSLGIMLAVVFVLAATLTLLPAVLAKLGPRVDKLALPWAHAGEHRSPRFAAWGERLWRRPVAYGARRAGGARRARRPGHCSSRPRCRRSRSSRRATARASATTRCRRPSDPARPARCRSSPGPQTRPRVTALAQHDPGVAARPAGPAQRRSRAGDRDPAAGPVRAPPSARRSTACGRELPAGALLGGAVAENHDLETALVGQGAARHRRRARRSASCCCSSRCRRR